MRQAKVAPDEQTRITEAGDGLLPPEESFRPEFVAEAEKSSKEHREGKKDEFVSAKNTEEVRTLLNQAIHE